MQDHEPAVVPRARPRWTEDRVERLLLTIFAEDAPAVAPAVSTPRQHAPRNALLVAVAAACLAMIGAALSARVDESAVDQYPLARWVGPLPAPSHHEMNIAASDETESMASDDEESDSDSDETAEAPRGADVEESAST